MNKLYYFDGIPDCPKDWINLLPQSQKGFYKIESRVTDNFEKSYKLLNIFNKKSWYVSKKFLKDNFINKKYNIELVNINTNNPWWVNKEFLKKYFQVIDDKIINILYRIQK